MIDQEKKTIHRRILLLGGTGAMGEHLTRTLIPQHYNLTLFISS